MTSKMAHFSFVLTVISAAFFTWAILENFEPFDIVVMAACGLLIEKQLRDTKLSEKAIPDEFKSTSRPPEIAKVEEMDDLRIPQSLLSIECESNLDDSEEIFQDLPDEEPSAECKALADPSISPPSQSIYSASDLDENDEERQNLPDEELDAECKVFAAPQVAIHSNIHNNSDGRPYKVLSAEDRVSATPQVRAHTEISKYSGYWWPLQIQINGAWVPESQSNTFNDIVLRLGQRGEGYDPRAIIEASFYEAGSSTAYHTAHAALHLDAQATCRDINIFNDADDQFEVTFNFFGSASVANVFNPRKSMTVEHRQLLNFLASLRNDDAERRLHLKVSGRFQAKEVIKSLGRDGKYPSFFPYRPKHSSITFGSIVSVDDLKDPHGQRASLFEYPAKDSFRDIDEYRLTYAYGEYQEWEFQRSLVQEIEDERHKVSFVTVERDMIFAKLKIQGLKPDAIHTSDGMRFKIKFVVPPHIPWNGRKAQVYEAAISDDVFRVSGPGELTLLLLDQDISTLPKIYTKHPNKNAPRFDCSVEAVIDINHIEKYLDMLYLLNHHPLGVRWKRLFVNEDACVAPAYNPSYYFCKTTAAKRNANSILSNILDKINANQSQRIAVTGLCTRHRTGAAVLEAAAGTGKSLCSAASVQYFLELGAHVVCATITNAASDNFLEKLQNLQAAIYGKDLPTDQAPIRLHRWKVEQANSEQGAPAQQDPASNTSSKTGTEATKSKKESTRNGSTLALEIEMYRAARKADQAKSFARPETSVSFATLAAADGGKTSVMDRYPHSLLATEKGKEPKLPTTTDIDMMAELRTFKARLLREPIMTWNPQDSQKFAYAFDICAKAVVGSRKCLVTTSMMVTKKVVERFATSAKGVIVVFEEASLARDPQILLTLLGAHWAHKISGMLLIGDRNQTGTLVTSVQKHCNAFGKQIERSLLERLQDGGFPVLTLHEQYRAHSTLIKFPNKRCYSGRLVTAAGVNERPGNECLDSKLIEILNVKTLDDARLAFIDIKGAETVRSKFSSSRSCLQTALWTCDLCMTLFKHLEPHGIKLPDVLVITAFYGDQIKVIKYLVREAVQKENQQRRRTGLKLLSMRDFPDIATVDSYQGDEKDFVVNVLGISRVDSPSDLGFVSDEKRANVACTRARRIFWMVGNQGLFRGSLMSNWTRYKDSISTDGNGSPPYLCQYAMEMNDAGRMQTFPSPPITTSQEKDYHSFTNRS